jgi:hypothetical protein
VASPTLSAACPVDLWLVDCQCSSPAGACSGAFGSDNTCVIRTNASLPQAYAVARCVSFAVVAAPSSLSMSMTFHVASALSFGTATVQCPDGSVLLGTIMLLWCYVVGVLMSLHSLQTACLALFRMFLRMLV